MRGPFAGALAAVLLLSVQARAQSPSPHSERTAAGRAAAAGTSQGEAQPDEQQVYEDQVVVTASKSEQTLVNAPATVSLITSETLHELGLDQLRGSVSRGAWPQRHADLGPRHQLHQPRRHLDALDVAARAGRRPQHLSRLLRLHRVGLPAGESRGDQADRGHPRPGLRDLGRQRHERRRQRHHEVAARAAGIERDDRRGRVRPQDRQRGRGRRRAVLRQRLACAGRSTIAGRTSSRPASTRRIRSPGRPARFPTARARSIRRSRNQGTTQPKVDVRADYDFEDGEQKLVFQGGFAGTDGILHSGIGPFDIDQGTMLGYVKVNYSKNAMKLNFFTNILNGDATNLLAVDVDGPAAALQVQEPDLRRRVRRRADVPAAARASATAAISATATSICRSRRPATRATRAAATCRTRSSSASTSAGWWARAWTSSTSSTTRSSRRGRR